jgi:hypothetical protein
MDEKKRDEIALFRFSVIAEFFSREFRPGEKTTLLREKVNQTYSIPYSPRNRIAPATLKQCHPQCGYPGWRPCTGGRHRNIMKP